MFRSLFLGQFTEASKDEINLSQVTTDNEAMEMILNFIYAGEIDINYENLGIIIKLSSFFLLDTLRGFCADYMNETLSLKTGLTYYLYSVDHGLSDLETSAGLMIKSRFHDVLIYNEDALNLSSEELIFLDDRDILKHCSTASFLQFLLKWLEKGKTESHLAAGVYLLDSMEARETERESMELCSGLTEINIEALFSKLSNSLEGIELDKKEPLLTKLTSAMQCLFTKGKKSHSVIMVSGMDEAGPSTQSPDKKIGKGFTSPKAETELAIVTVTPKLCVIEDYRKQREDVQFHLEVEPFRQPVFDICAYVPKTRTWYYLCELHERNTPEYLVDGAGYESRFLVVGDYATFIDNRGDSIDMFNLQTKEWHSPDIHYFDLNFDGEFNPDVNFQANDVCYVVGKDNAQYMIVRMRLFTDQSFDQAIEMYFRGYILRDDGESWDCIFVSPHKIRTNLSDNGGMPEINARISKTSNELLVTHSTLDGGWNVVFVANLNDTFPVPFTLKSEYIENQDEFRGISILENDEAFLIVANGTKCFHNKIQVLYEYKFNSKHLRDCSANSKKMVVSTMLGPYYEDDEEIEYPCLCEVSITDGSSIWYMEGNMENVSAFSEVRFDEIKRPEKIEHPPPPFACFTRAFAGQISKKHLANAKQLTRFLLKEKTNTTFFSGDRTLLNTSLSRYTHFSMIHDI